MSNEAAKLMLMLGWRQMVKAAAGDEDAEVEGERQEGVVFQL